MKRSATQLSEESLRASELLRGKVVSHIARNRESEVLVEFTDGARLFVDQAPHGMELSITGENETGQGAQFLVCCFCSESINRELPVELVIRSPEGEVQALWAHSRCLNPHLHSSVPLLSAG